MNDLRTATAEEIEHNYGLYTQAVKIMQKCGENLPGFCCGKHQDQHCRHFVQNREKYINIMENIEKRIIKPLKSGPVFIAPLKTMVNYDFMTDKEILFYVENGYLPKDFFDWSNYKEQSNEKIVNNEIANEKPTQKTTKKSKKTKK